MTMKILTGTIALVFALALVSSTIAVAAQNAASPVPPGRALGGLAVAALAQACKDKRPGVIVNVGGRQTACPTPSGRFFNTCEECNGSCPGPCFLTSASNCQCMLEHQ
jgi:hypothetical protein